MPFRSTGDFYLRTLIIAIEPTVLKKDLKEMNVDSVIIPGECTKYIQVLDVCWNKPFKATMTKLYDRWLSEDAHQFTEGGKK